MVTLVQQDPPNLETTLSDRVRPIVAGTEINADCTLGHIGWKDAGGWPDYSQGAFALTASHCTSSRYAILNDVFGQPNYLFDIGVEVDEVPVTSYDGWYCLYPSCQAADAAVIQIRDSVGYAGGYAAKSSSVSQPPAPYIGTQYIANNSVTGALTGEKATKVGRTTGETAGKITASCVNSNSNQYPNLWTLCNHKISLSSAGGDSGAPVFIKSGEPNHSNTPRLVGLLWGGVSGVAWVSPMQQIRQGLGNRYWF